VLSIIKKKSQHLCSYNDDAVNMMSVIVHARFSQISCFLGTGYLNNNGFAFTIVYQLTFIFKALIGWRKKKKKVKFKKVSQSLKELFLKVQNCSVC